MEIEYDRVKVLLPHRRSQRKSYIHEQAARQDAEERWNLKFDELYRSAKAVVNPRRLSEDVEVAGVGAALLTQSGSVYTGVCIDTACSMGFCAEHAAAAAMITAGENHVIKMVAVGGDGKVMPPCGRCREFISQLHPDNLSAEVMVAETTFVTLQELLPYHWRSTPKQAEESAINGRM